MSIQAPLLWLVTWTGLFAVSGFLLVVARGLSGRPWRDRTLLRWSVTLAFVGSIALWVALLMVPG